MSNFTYLLITEDSNRVPVIFACQEGGFISVGDLVEQGGELFHINDKCFLDTAGDEYRILENIVGIRTPDRIFCVTWKRSKEEEKDGN